MVFLQDNCIATYKLPKEAGSAINIDYSSELDLFASLDVDEGVFLWNPQNQKVVANIEKDWDGMCDVLFLPNNFLAISEGEGNHGSDIRFVSLEDIEELVSFEIDDRELPLDYPGSLALCADGDLLISEIYGTEISKIHVDFVNMKLLEGKDIWTCNQAEDGGIESVCCSKNWNIVCTSHDDAFFSSVDVKFSEAGDVELSNEQEMISEYMVNGETKQFESVNSVAHDGENILVATNGEILLLESATHGSVAHTVASDVSPSQIRLNCRGQLLVCDQTEFIKVYDYKKPNTLQDLCRYQINNIIGQNKKQKEIRDLPIPQTLKNYLLYKT